MKIPISTRARIDFRMAAAEPHTRPAATLSPPDGGGFHESPKLANSSRDPGPMR